MEHASAAETFAVAPPAGEAHRPASEPPAPHPWGWGERFHMPVFKPGTKVRLEGQWETVNYVALRRDQLLVYLVGRDGWVDPDRLELAPTVFTTRRVGELR